MSQTTPVGMQVRCAFDRMVPIPDLMRARHPRNPNKHPPQQIQRLSEILRYQGVRAPARLSTRSGRLTAGHGRIEAAELLGWSEYPVDDQDYDDDESEYADLVADNAISSWADLDLKMINEDVPELGPDFDIDLLGLEDFTLDASEKYGNADDVPATPAVARTKRGELWLLGEHRLLCGDATSREDVERLLQGGGSGPRRHIAAVQLRD